MSSYWSSTPECESSERVAVVVMYPRHFHGEQIEPTAIFQTEQLDRIEVSAARLAWTCPDTIYNEIVRSALRRAQSARPIGMITAQASEIVELSLEGILPFVVRADGLREFPGHAVIGFNENVKSGKAFRKMLRAALVEAFTPTQPPCALHGIDTGSSWLRATTSTHPAAARYATA